MEDNTLKHLVVEIGPDKSMVQDAVSKSLRPAMQPVLVLEVQVAYHVADRRACRCTMGISVFGFSYAVKDDSRTSSSSAGSTVKKVCGASR